MFLAALVVAYFAALVGVLLFARPPGAPERPCLVAIWLKR